MECGRVAFDCFQYMKKKNEINKRGVPLTMINRLFPKKMYIPYGFGTNSS